MMGLVDVDALENLPRQSNSPLNPSYDANGSGLNETQSGSGRGAVGTQSGGCRGEEMTFEALPVQGYKEIVSAEAENARLAPHTTEHHTVGITAAPFLS